MISLATEDMGENEAENCIAPQPQYVSSLYMAKYLILDAAALM